MNNNATSDTNNGNGNGNGKNMVNGNQDANGTAANGHGADSTGNGAAASTHASVLPGAEPHPISSNIGLDLKAKSRHLQNIPFTNVLGPRGRNMQDLLGNMAPGGMFGAGMLPPGFSSNPPNPPGYFHSAEYFWMWDQLKKVLTIAFIFVLLSPGMFLNFDLIGAAMSTETSFTLQGKGIITVSRDTLITHTVLFALVLLLMKNFGLLNTTYTQIRNATLLFAILTPGVLLNLDFIDREFSTGGGPLSPSPSSMNAILSHSIIFVVLLHTFGIWV